MTGLLKLKYIWFVLAILMLVLAFLPWGFCYNTAVIGSVILTAPLGIGTGYLSSLLLISDAAAEWSKPVKLLIAWASFYAGGFLQWYILLPLAVRLFKKPKNSPAAEAENETEPEKAENVE